MKKILITLTVLFAVIDIMAQEHLSFKGIPIEAHPFFGHNFCD